MRAVRNHRIVVVHARTRVGFLINLNLPKQRRRMRRVPRRVFCVIRLREVLGAAKLAIRRLQPTLRKSIGATQGGGSSRITIRAGVAVRTRTSGVWWRIIASVAPSRHEDPGFDSDRRIRSLRRRDPRSR